uniref:Helitron helicase-like domain-containing protein n=1 Tax=Acrobeloides nanus TaxID=290746 RepID=A0A914D0P6_9BILA
MKNQVFEKTAAYVAIIEFQKRGLPHMHLLQILDKKVKIVSAELVDDFISAEIPDRRENLVFYELALSSDYAWIASKNRGFFERGIDMLPEKWEAVIEIDGEYAPE